MFIKKIALLILIGIFFGTHFVFTKLALIDCSPVTVGMLRVLIGALFIAAITPIFSQQSYSSKLSPYRFSIIAFFEVTLPAILIPWGQQHITTSITSVLITTMPIFAMLFGLFMIKSEKLHWLSFVSVMLGFIGVCILLNPPLDSSVFQYLLPEFAILLASASWAIAMVLIKKVPPYCPFKLTRNILFAASIQIFPIWLLFGGVQNFTFSWTACIGIFFLGASNSGLVYVLYVFLIRLAGVTFAAFSSYLVPIVGIFVGTLFLNESLYLHQFIGCIVILLGLVLQSIYQKLSRSKSS